MNFPVKHCNERTLIRFLNHELDLEEQTKLSEHLNECEKCSDKLERRTAQPDWWQIAGEFLRDGPFELQPLAEGLTRCFDEDSQESANPAIERVLEQLAPTDNPESLGRIGNYEVTGVVGSGGMGVVLKAFDPALNRYVAVKTLCPHLAASGAARKRFARESQAAAAVVHENVSEIYGVHESNGLSYLVMPYVPGPSLQRRLDEWGPLRLPEILRVAVQTAWGLAAAHAHGLVHRDIKPANILLADGVERVRITDFGLARAADDASLTRTGVIVGTPQYMSPEQSRGEAVDHRSDLFSLGSVMYAMCTGRPPFRAESSYGILRRITDNEPRAIREIQPAIPEWLCFIIRRLHSKQPEDRFQSAEEVAELLEQCLAHVQTPHMPLPGKLFALRFCGRLRQQKVLTALFALTILFLGVSVWWAANDRAPVANHLKQETQSERDEGFLSPPLMEQQTSHPPRTDSISDWNSTAEEMETLTRDLDGFELRAQRFWDQNPTANSSQETALNLLKQERKP